MPQSRWFRFFWLWLAIACASQAALGYLIVFTIDTPLWSWHQEPMAEVFWGTPDVPAAVQGYRHYAMGMLGPTITAWAVALLFVVLVPFRRGERWAWWCIAASLAVWFPLDTAISIAEAIAINVWFNIGGLAMIAIPLAATFRDFHRRAPGSPGD